MPDELVFYYGLITRGVNGQLPNHFVSNIKYYKRMCCRLADFPRNIILPDGKWFRKEYEGGDKSDSLVEWRN